MLERENLGGPIIPGAPDAPFDLPHPEILARMLVNGFRAILSAGNRMILEEATATAYLTTREHLDHLGFASIGDAAHVCLKLSHTVVKERLRVHRSVTSRAALHQAFLDGRISKCQIVVLHSIFEDPSRSDAEIHHWIDLCEKKTVRELKTLVRKARRKQRDAITRSTDNAPPDPDGLAPDSTGDSASDATDDIEPERDMVRFPAPPVFAAALEDQYEIVRRHLGYDAPREECWKVLMAESDYAGRGVPESPNPHGIKIVARILRIPPHRLGYSYESGLHAMHLLRSLQAFIEEVPELDPAPDSNRLGVTDTITHLFMLSLRKKTVDAFCARLIRSLRETRSLYVLGYDRVEDLIEGELGISERSARDMVRLANAFDSLPPLGLAFESGRIGADAVHRIRQVATIRNCRAWIRRAAGVTSLQLARECDLFLSLQRIDPAFQHLAPFPTGEIEAVLSERLIRRHGWTQRRLGREYKNAGIRVSKGGSPDPAETPSLMRKIEILVRLLQLEIWDDPPEDEDPRMDAHERQVFALARRPVWITIAGPTHLIADVKHAIAEIRARSKERIEKWMAALIILHKARASLSQVDPEARPSRLAILKRDEYRCCVPGCTRRCGLESHHVEWRSRGGRDTIDNQTTACSLHHRMIHDGHIRVSGNAPDGLTWEIGCRVDNRHDGPPLLVYRGQKLREDFLEEHRMAESNVPALAPPSYDPALTRPSPRS